jgi:hypothetical protein
MLLVRFSRVVLIWWACDLFSCFIRFASGALSYRDDGPGHDRVSLRKLREHLLEHGNFLGFGRGWLWRVRWGESLRQDYGFVVLIVRYAFGSCGAATRSCRHVAD